MIGQQAALSAKSLSEIRADPLSLHLLPDQALTSSPSKTVRLDAVWPRPAIENLIMQIQAPSLLVRSSPAGSSAKCYLFMFDCIELLYWPSLCSDAILLNQMLPEGLPGNKS